MINGYVYLLVEIDALGFETYKIGVSKNDVIFRLNQLRTGNSNEIRIINSYQSINYVKIEKWLHRKYINQKTLANNEWFNLSNDQVSSFISDCISADETITYLKENNHFYK